MDSSSQVPFIQNGRSLADLAVSELNHQVQSKCTPDKKVPENPNNLGNHKSAEASNERAIGKDESKKLSQQVNQTKGRSSKRKITFTSSPRVLRARSQDKSKTSELVNTRVQDVGSKEKKTREKKQIRKIPNNEFSKIKTHLRYLLNRMNYEQNFIDAYVGEGWKGQSLEKIKPEKELERAKSDISRYKLKIRDLFQRIDTSLAEGRIPESLFDSEGLIDSEDIFCAKCGHRDVRLDNDIILCDGACERGFHQFCLEPPLLKEQVPPGDEGWLCPACDCKIDCINLLNDSQGNDLSVGDSWEKVFPEAAASGDKQDDISELPSDDDYNPGGPTADEGESIADESEFSSASEDLAAAANNEPYLGLPSEDSEDDDYNPDRGVGSGEQAMPESSSLDSDSDFTSDSEDLTDVYKGERPLVSDNVENSEELPESGMEDDGSARITAKRHVEKLDYKKLHDETYGNVSSDSSDEDFTDTHAPTRRKHTKGAENQNQIQSQSAKKLDVEGASKHSSALGSSGSSSTKSANRRLGEAATQRLYESFQENHYPSRDVKELLAKELNLTVNQVSKWFENARWSFNHHGTQTNSDKPLQKHRK